MDMEDVGYNFESFQAICLENKIPKSKIEGFWGYCNDTPRGYEENGIKSHFQQYQSDISQFDTDC